MKASLLITIIAIALIVSTMFIDTPIIYGLIFIISGIFIRNKRLTILVAGYNTSSKEQKENFEKDYDTNKYFKFVGNNIILVGLIVGLSEVLYYFNYDVEVVETIAILAVVTRVIYVSNDMIRYKKV